MNQERPNVVCIVADDLGWRDLGCYGSSFYETPNIDLLARQGARFTDAYASAPVCSPTRASLMTGKYPAHVGITNWLDGELEGKLLEPEYRHRLPDEETTLAEALSDAGYATWHVGKWHLGGAERDSNPEDHGFDVNIAGCGWAAPRNGYFSPWEIPTLEDPAEEGRYLPDRLGEEAVSLVEAHAETDEPFFLNYCPYLVHTPIQAPESAVERYERKRQRLGLDKVKEIEIGERFPSEWRKDQRIKRRLVQGHPTYAAMVEALDRNVGRVLETLNRTDQVENTVVIFTSDNGGLATAEGSPTTNLPLSEGKGWLADGGNRVPLIVRWPGVTDAIAESELHESPVTTPDLYPTILRAADVQTPTHQTVDGVDLKPVLEGDGLERDAVFWHFPHYGPQGGTPAGAVRAGRWKLVEYFEDDSVELFDLDEDVREECDLSDHRPEKTAELLERLHNWRQSVEARMPEPNPDYEPWEDRAGPD